MPHYKGIFVDTFFLVEAKTEKEAQAKMLAQLQEQLNTDGADSIIAWEVPAEDAL